METDSPDDSNSSNAALYEREEVTKRQQQQQLLLQQPQQQQRPQEHMQPSSSQRFVPPLPPSKPLCGVPRTMLYSGSHFHGSQKSRGNCYDVEVILQYVDLEAGRLCGYLIIKGLTDDYPTLTTFFHGEVIGRKHPFLTRKWDADEEVDRKHWSKFTSFIQVYY
uniref:Uncharacterized protein n=1 Tax=Plectus sambesii TaxID=2011161 RepID=A0A914V217_9BILA